MHSIITSIDPMVYMFYLKKQKLQFNHTPINRFRPRYIPGQWVGKGGNLTVGEFGLLFDQIPT